MKFTGQSFKAHSARTKENLTNILLAHITNPQFRRVLKSDAGEDYAIRLDNKLLTAGAATSRFMPEAARELKGKRLGVGKVHARVFGREIGNDLLRRSRHFRRQLKARLMVTGPAIQHEAENADPPNSNFGSKRHNRFKLLEIRLPHTKFQFRSKPTRRASRELISRRSRDPGLSVIALWIGAEAE